MPESCPVSSSHERSRNTAAPAARQTHTRNIAFASPPHTGCTPRSRHTQSPYPDLAAAQSARASPLEGRPRGHQRMAQIVHCLHAASEKIREKQNENGLGQLRGSERKHAHAEPAMRIVRAVKKENGDQQQRSN